MTDKKKYAYITREIYEAALNVDLQAEDQLEQFDRAVYYASALLNSFTGHRIEGIGFDNLSELQQGGVREATVFQVAHFLNSGELDGQRGTGSYAGGGQTFSFSLPGEPDKVLRVDEKAIFALQQVGLLNTVTAFDPLKKPQARKEPQHKYHRWGIGTLDESLFVSDGTTEDGGTVGLKISNKFQKEIEKTSIVSKQDTHLSYHHTFNSDKWPDNALIHKGYLAKYYPDNHQLRKEWDKFWGEVNGILSQLKEDWVAYREDVNKRVALVDEAFSKLVTEVRDFFAQTRSEWTDFKGVVEATLETLRSELTKFEEHLEGKLSDETDKLKKRIEEAMAQVEGDIRAWVKRELKKPEYRGPKGEPGEGVTDNLRKVDKTVVWGHTKDGEIDTPYVGICPSLGVGDEGPANMLWYDRKTQCNTLTMEVFPYVNSLRLGKNYLPGLDTEVTLEVTGKNRGNPQGGTIMTQNVHAYHLLYRVPRNAVSTSYLYIDGNRRQGLKEVVEALGIGTVERKELTSDEVCTYNDHKGKTQTRTAMGTGEWVLKDNHFKTLQSQVASLSAKVASLEAQLKKKGSK